MSDYITRAPRIINGNWIIGFIKKNQEEKAEEAFRNFCSELMYGKQINLACKITKRKMKVPLTTVTGCPQKHFPEEKSTYEVYVG